MKTLVLILSYLHQQEYVEGCAFDLRLWDAGSLIVTSWHGKTEKSVRMPKIMFARFLIITERA